MKYICFWYNRSTCGEHIVHIDGVTGSSPVQTTQSRIITRIVLLIALYVLASVFEALDEIVAVLAPVMNSGIGMVVTVAVTAYVTYRWYMKRRRAERN